MRAHYLLSLLGIVFVGKYGIDHNFHAMAMAACVVVSQFNCSRLKAHMEALTNPR